MLTLVILLASLSGSHERLRQLISCHLLVKVALLLSSTALRVLFRNFINEDFREMATETNRYASAYFQKNPKETHSTFSQLKQWVDVSVSEMRAFTSIILAMGLIYGDDIKDYWSTHHVMSIPSFFFFFRV